MAAVENDRHCNLSVEESIHGEFLRIFVLKLNITSISFNTVEVLQCTFRTNLY